MKLNSPLRQPERGLGANPRAQHVARLAGSALGIALTTSAAFAAGRDHIGYAALGAVLLLLAVAAWTATRRNRHGVAAVTSVADIGDIATGQEGVPERGTAACRGLPGVIAPR